MAALTTTTISVASGIVDLDSSLVAANSGGDTTEVGPNKILVVKNGDASTKTVTIDTPGTKSGFAIANGSYAILAGDYAIVPLADIFRGATGRASVTYSAVTSVLVGVFELGS